MTPGDVNHDSMVDLTDAVLTLQLLTGIAPAQTIFKDADVNQDGRIGTEELIYSTNCGENEKSFADQVAGALKLL